MVTGAISGYREIGKPSMQMMPSIVVTMEITPAIIGCLMKNGDIIIQVVRIC